MNANTEESAMCSSCTRRCLLAGVASTLMLGNVVARSATVEPPTLCGAATGPDLRSLPRQCCSANPAMDHALIAELRNIVRIIPVNPGFQYITGDGVNAGAMPVTTIPGTRGTVLIGLELVKVLMRQEGGGAAVAGVCAHECAHIYQYGSQQLLDHLSGSTNVLLELHADFISGYYMGKRRHWTSDAVVLFADALAQLNQAGASDYTRPDYHGTSELRVEAMDRGYVQSSANAGFEDVATMGVEFVKALVRSAT